MRKLYGVASRVNGCEHPILIIATDDQSAVFSAPGRIIARCAVPYESDDIRPLIEELLLIALSMAPIAAR